MFCLHAVLYSTRYQVALRNTPGTSVCINEACTLSGGMAHAGPCEPCDCGAEHAIAECPTLNEKGLMDMGDVVNLRTCKCGRQGSRVEADFRGESVGYFVACESCVKNTVELLDRVRPVFDAMITAGLCREHANEVMSFLLEKIG